MARKNSSVTIVRQSDSLKDWSQDANVRLAAIGASFPQPEVPPTFVPEIGELVRAADGRGIHYVARVKGDMFAAECGRVYRIGEPGQPGDLINSCAYCNEGTFAPVDATDDKPRKVKAAKAGPSAEELAAAEAKAAQERRFLINRVVNGLYESLNTLGNSAPAESYVETLTAAIKLVKGARVSTTGVASGPKSPRATYDVQPTVEGDSPELARIRELADAGSERAKVVIAHVDSWRDADGKVVSTKDKLPEGLCSYCKSVKHIRRTGFFSAAVTIAQCEKQVAEVTEEVAA